MNYPFKTSTVLDSTMDLQLEHGKVYHSYLILIHLSNCLTSISVCYLTGRVLSPFLRSISLCGTGYQRKFSFQLKPPYVISEPAMYSNVSSLITSMMGHTTVFLWNTHTSDISNTLSLLWPHLPERMSFVRHRMSLFYFEFSWHTLRHTSLYSNRCRHKSEGTSR